VVKEKPTLLVQRKGCYLVPHSGFDAAIIEGFRQGVPLKADIKQQREPESNRLYWSVLSAVCAATGKWHNAEALHASLKIALDIVEIIPGIHGEPHILPGSISFRAMSEEKFLEFTRAAYDLITTELCPGMTVDELLGVGKDQLAPGETV